MSEDLERKYGYTGNSISVNGHDVHEIRTLRSFGSVKKGELGGFIESEENLSHEGKCWVGRRAVVYENARVYEDACVEDTALVYGNAKVHGKARVNNGYIRENVEIFGHAYFSGYIAEGNAKIYDAAKIFDKAIISGRARIFGFDGMKIYDNAVIKNNGFIRDTEISGNVEITGKTSIYNSCLSDNAKIYSGNVYNVNLVDDAIIDIPEDEIKILMENFNDAVFGRHAHVRGHKSYISISLPDNLMVTIHKINDLSLFVYFAKSYKSCRSFSKKDAIDYIFNEMKLSYSEKMKLKVLINTSASYLDK